MKTFYIRTLNQLQQVVPTVTGLVATPISQSEIDISYNQVANASYYIIFRNGIQVGTDTAPPFQDTGLATNTTYSYTMSVVTSNGQSAQSAPVTASTLAISGPPTQTTTMQDQVISPSQINLIWFAVTNATSYNVYQNGVLISTGGVARSLNVTGLTPNTLYSFTVSGVNSFGEGPQSAPVTATTQTAIPGQVTGLTASASQNVITLSWNPVAGATSYNLYNSGTTIPTAASITDSQGAVWTVSSGVVLKNGTNAGFSASVILLLYYNGVIYQENSSNQWFSWQGTAWSTILPGDPRGGTAPIVTGITNTSYIDSGLLFSTQYTFTAAAVNSSGIGIPSTGVSATTGSSGVIPTGFGIINTNGILTNLQGTKMPLYVVCVSGLETMNSGGSRVAGFPAATQAQWAQALTSWGPSKGRNIQAQPNALRFQLISSYWNGDTGVVTLPDSGGYYSGGAPRLSAATYQAAVIQTITRATAAGWVCILSLCFDSITEPNGTVHLAQGQPIAPGPTAVKFWASVAAAFKNNPAVVFELFNESILSSLNYSNGSFGTYNAAAGGNPFTANPAGPVSPGPDMFTYLNAQSATTVFSPPAGNNPAGCLMMNNGANSSTLQFICSSMKLAGVNEIINAIANANAQNLIIVGMPSFSGGIDAWGGVGITDPRGNNQVGAAYHAYGQGHWQSIAALQAAGIPTITTEAGFGNWELANGGLTYSRFYNAGLGYSAGSNGWNNWGGGSNIMTGGASPLTTAPENQSQPIPNGSN